MPAVVTLGEKQELARLLNKDPSTFKTLGVTYREFLQAAEGLPKTGSPIESISCL